MICLYIFDFKCVVKKISALQWAHKGFTKGSNNESRRLTGSFPFADLLFNFPCSYCPAASRN